MSERVVGIRKGKDLSDIERGRIASLYEEGYSYYRIGKMLGRSDVTIANEIRRGKITVIKNYFDKEIYSPETSQLKHDNNRRKCGVKIKGYGKCEKFLKWIEEMVLVKKYSIDAAVGYAKKHNLFSAEEMVCTKTIYNYVEKGKIKIKNIDLPNKVRRRVKSDRPTQKRKKSTIGRSIEERDSIVNDRQEFGHWENDLIIGKKSNDQVLLTLTERVTRKNYIVKIESKTVEAVKEGLRRIFSEMGDYKKIVKSITSDNGVEFSRLYELEEEEGIKVFYAHPYSSFERGTNENCNGIVRRKIPKSTYIKKYSDEDIRRVEQWVNDMPRKILGYRTANESYEQELKKLGISA